MTGKILALIALTFACSVTLRAQDAAQVERGKYLVHSVAMCVQCHSARDASGEIARNGVLKGGIIPFKSPYPRLRWANRAPQIAGLNGWDTAEFVNLLTKGSRYDGQMPRRPMPPFRMQEADAQAIAAYLTSLR